MLVANSFDLWKKDGFFSAAEQVQESADTMEFAYRTWVREIREGLSPDDLDELRREVQTALGTAKWQLEEFEKAVRVSYRARSEEHLLERHRLFIAAIGNQISHIEAALRESYDKEGKKPLRWVNLNEEESNEEECDDLATLRRVDDGLCKMDRSTKARRASSPSAPDLQIVIVDENRERKQSITSLEVSRKGKSGSVFWKLGCQKFPQFFGRVQQGQIYRPWHLQLACSVQFTLALMLTIFLIVPIVFYSA
ncbi:hypothetical protein SDJN03_08644, partial [Cucurbita argyrosperma subsp. sororia]